jgi:cytochrome c oxidase subunit I+III
MTEQPNDPLRLHAAFEDVWASPKGWRSLAAVNHTVIGKRFMATAVVFFLIGGILAMMIRAQLATSQTQWLTPAAYNQVFTMHGTVMMFLFAIPLIEGFTLYMLPKLLGARDLAFPRLSAFGYWCYLFGGLILLAALLVGAAPDGGWFMYTPLSSKPYSPGLNADVWLLGVTFVEVSAVCAAIEFMVTVLKIRTGGMSLGRMPILAWYLWVTAAMMLFGFPPLILGSILLELERAFGWPFFTPELGGDPLLWQHLFWLFGHPEVYIIFLPAAGVVSTVLPTLSGRPIIGYAWLVAALIAQGFISFGLWAHHMFTTGIPKLSLAFFSAASLLVVFPTAVQVFAWIATLLKGRPRLELPMLYILGFLFIFTAGGLTGVMVALIPFDVQAHDTYFVVAHLHYVLIGGFLFPVLAGLYYWLPHITGNETYPVLGRTAFWLIFLGFNVSSLPMHLTGLLGMRRRIAGYPQEAGWNALNLLSSVAGFVLAFGFALVVIDTILTLRFSRMSRRDPWKAGTLEWQMPTPPAAYNVAAQPRITERDPAWTGEDLGAKLASGQGYLSSLRNGWRETPGVDAVSGEPDQIIIYPRPTFIPLLTAACLGGFVLCMLFKLYLLCILPLAGVAASVWWWLWQSGQKTDFGLLDAGLGTRLPPHTESSAAPTYWGLVFTLMANGTLFSAFVFGFLFLWSSASGWPPDGSVDLAMGLLLMTAIALMAAAVFASMAARQDGPFLPWTAACASLAVTGFAVLFGQLVAYAPEHAYFATLTFAAGYGFFHAFIGVLMALFAILRERRGYISKTRRAEIRASRLWQLYSAGSGLIVLGILLTARAL